VFWNVRPYSLVDVFSRIVPPPSILHIHINSSWPSPTYTQSHSEAHFLRGTDVCTHSVLITDQSRCAERKSTRTNAQCMPYVISAVHCYTFRPYSAVRWATTSVTCAGLNSRTARSALFCFIVPPTANSVCTAKFM